MERKPPLPAIPSSLSALFFSFSVQSAAISCSAGELSRANRPLVKSGDGRRSWGGSSSFTFSSKPCGLVEYREDNADFEGLVEINLHSPRRLQVYYVLYGMAAVGLVRPGTWFGSLHTPAIISWYFKTHEQQNSENSENKSKLEYNASWAIKPHKILFGFDNFESSYRDLTNKHGQASY